MYEEITGREGDLLFRRLSEELGSVGSDIGLGVDEFRIDILLMSMAILCIGPTRARVEVCFEACLHPGDTEEDQVEKETHLTVSGAEFLIDFVLQTSGGAADEMNRNLILNKVNALARPDNDGCISFRSFYRAIQSDSRCLTCFERAKEAQP